MSQAFEQYKDKGLTGLANLGNTCYMNSVIQCLSHSYELNEFLSKEGYKEKLNKKSESLLLVEWDKLRKLIWSENCIISPGGFLSSVQKVAKIKDRDIFTGYSQNDFSEFLLFLLESFHEAINREVNMTISGSVMNNTDELAKVCFNRIKTMYKNEYSEFIDMFFGISVSKISGKNSDYLNILPEPFLLLNLALPEKSLKFNKTSSLHECFDLHTKTEDLETPIEIDENTGEKDNGEKQVVFWSLPNVLIITLKRFYGNKKIQSLIEFPLEDLDLTKYIVGYDKESYKYDLYGICNHMGGPLGGHYTAFVKNPNDNWYHFNDTNVNKIDNISKLVSPNAYCLFYRKKK